MTQLPSVFILDYSSTGHFFKIICAFRKMSDFSPFPYGHPYVPHRGESIDNCLSLFDLVHLT